MKVLPRQFWRHERHEGNGSAAAGAPRDVGYVVTEMTDACLTYSQERHDNSLRAIKSYCRQRTTDQVIAELA